LPILKEQFFGNPVTVLFLEFLGIILALGTLMVLFVMTILSRKSQEVTEITAKVAGTLKPLIWLGIAITGFVWLYIMFQNPLNIIGLVNSMVLIIAIILSAFVSSKISKMEFGKTPIISTTILVLIWWLFVYWAITVI
jgi:ABC-type antimicrobial peptide transport system permease subunit